MAISLICFVLFFTDGECLSPENTSPYVSGNASPVESHHQHHHQQQQQQQCYDLPPMTAMNMTVQQPGSNGGGGGSHYSSNSPASYPGSVSPIISQTGLNNNDFSAFPAYYVANGANGSQQQQHYYSNVIQQHSPDVEEQQTLMSS